MGVAPAAIIGDNPNVIPMSEVPKNQGEYFNVRIMEIDQELLRFDLCKGGNLGLDTTKENIFNPVMATIDAVTQLSSSHIVTQGKSKEHAFHMIKKKKKKPKAT